MFIYINEKEILNTDHIIKAVSLSDNEIQLFHTPYNSGVSITHSQCTITGFQAKYIWQVLMHGRTVMKPSSI